MASRRKKYIPGIYNYCDRWCERCSMTDRCSLLAQETRAKKLHLARGEDPNDLDVMLKDVQTSLSKTMKMLVEKAEEEGIDLDEGLDEVQDELQSDRDFCSAHPLHEMAFRLARQSHAFLETLASEIQSEQFKGSQEDILVQIQDCFEILSWYHMQQAVKIDRCLRSLRHTNGVTDPEELDAVLYDANGSAKVAYLGLVRMLDAFTRLHQWNASWNSRLMPLIQSIYDVLEKVDHEFPGHKAFKRPGFDD